MTTTDYSGERDRRRAPRVETDIYGTMSDTAGEVRCRILNVSRLGTMAVSPNPLPEMAQVKLRFAVPKTEGRKSLTCEAAVVRCTRRADRQYDIGLFFTRIAPEDRATLDEIVAHDSARRIPV